MTQYTTYITIGNREGDLRDYLVSQYGVTKEQAQSVLDADPYRHTSREDQFQWIKRTIIKIKALRS